MFKYLARKESIAMFLLVMPCASASEPAPVKRLSVINDRAAGVKFPALIRINGMPCGSNGTDPYLICMRPAQTLAAEQQQSLFKLSRPGGVNAKVTGWMKEGAQTGWTELLQYEYLVLPGWRDHQMDPGIRPG